MEGNYVERAEEVITKLVDEVNNYYKNGKKGERKELVTTSKIRNILSMVSDLYNDTQRFKGEELSDEMYMRTQYLKMRMAYEAGRDNATRDFINKAKLIDEINNVKKSKSALLNFCHYVEALVAYHKFYGGKEN